MNDSRANDDHRDEYMGSALHHIQPSEISNAGDPASHGWWYPTWPLDHRAALLAALEPGATAMFGPVTLHLHLAHAEEATQFNDRRRSAGGEGRRTGPGRDRYREE